MYFNLPYGHNMWQNVQQVFGGQFWDGKYQRGHQQVDQIRGGQAEQQVVKIALHFVARQHNHGQYVS